MKINQSQAIIEAMKTRPPALEPWKNRKHVRIRQQANDLVASGKLKPQACQHRGCGVGPAKTVKHHVSYDRPDNVKWYCGPHHDAAHAVMDKMPVESCSAKCNTCGQESCRCIADRTTNQSQIIILALLEAKGVFTSLKNAQSAFSSASSKVAKGGVGKRINLWKVMDKMAFTLSDQLKQAGVPNQLIRPRDSESRYVYIGDDLDGFKIRIADHDPPVSMGGKEVGGFDTSKGVRHRVGDYNVYVSFFSYPPPGFRIHGSLVVAGTKAIQWWNKIRKVG